MWHVYDAREGSAPCIRLSRCGSGSMRPGSRGVRDPGGINYVTQRQTAVTADLETRQLLLFVLE